MSPENALWSLLHIESKTQFDSLTFPQAAVLAASFNELEWSNWAAWYEGLADWQQLDDLVGVLHVRRSEPVHGHMKPPPFQSGVGQHTLSNVNLVSDRSFVSMPNLERAVAGELPNHRGIQREPVRQTEASAETVVTQSGVNMLESEPPLGFVTNSKPAFATASEGSFVTHNQKTSPFHGDHSEPQSAQYISSFMVAPKAKPQDEPPAPKLPPSDGRLSKRFLKRYKAVLLLSKGKMFETQTVDLSLTGIQVVDPVPFGSEGPFEVLLVNSKNEQMQLIATLITNDQKRTRMKIVRAAKLDQLHSWLLNPGQ